MLCSRNIGGGLARMELERAAESTAAVVICVRVTTSQTHFLRCCAHVSYPARSYGDKGGWVLELG